MGTGEANIRVGTTDRERAVDALANHLAEGRLEVAEYEQRCGAATAARTRADLLALFDDLPAPHPVFDEPQAAEPPAPVAEQSDLLLDRPAPRRAKVAMGAFVGVAVAAVVAVAAITATWWALAPILVIGLLLVLFS
ncbi:DUF1707 SHOCT-like domain-containing protein [Actinokineospora iranica]|uniref:DUF1707 domain-containing protein n=1 Tax=Actinokineospora iranica TaxID=1271860 RepID=A0A1G6WC50_9PSEU|nr:DUF1707 domain-containing protein [Actinokineospora iranica]SDD63432.1 protein of unknown function [Actinokineospora iranica]